MGEVMTLNPGVLHANAPLRLKRRKKRKGVIVINKKGTKAQACAPILAAFARTHGLDPDQVTRRAVAQVATVEQSAQLEACAADADAEDRQIKAEADEEDRLHRFDIEDRKTSLDEKRHKLEERKTRAELKRTDAEVSAIRAKTKADLKAASQKREADKRKKVAKAITEARGGMIALEVPTHVAERLIADWTADGRRDTRGVERPEDLHVTLAYLPGLTGEQLKAGVRAARSAAYGSGPGVSLHLTHLAVIGNGERAVVYEPRDSKSVAVLRSIVTDALDREGVAWSDRFPFRPHVTLAYLGDDQPDPSDGPLPHRGIPFTATNLIVTDGSKQVVARIPLGEPAEIVVKEGRYPAGDPEGRGGQYRPNRGNSAPRARHGDKVGSRKRKLVRLAALIATGATAGHLSSKGRVGRAVFGTGRKEAGAWRPKGTHLEVHAGKAGLGATHRAEEHVPGRGTYFSHPIVGRLQYHQSGTSLNNVFFTPGSGVVGVARALRGAARTLTSPINRLRGGNKTPQQAQRARRIANSWEGISGHELQRRANKEGEWHDPDWLAVERSGGKVHSASSPNVPHARTVARMLEVLGGNLKTGRPANPVKSGKPENEIRSGKPVKAKRQKPASDLNKDYQETKAKIRHEARRAAENARGDLEVWGLGGGIRGPGQKSVGKQVSGGEWDWFRSLGAGEKARLRKGGYIRSDRNAIRVDEAMDMIARRTGVERERAMGEWLHRTRIADAGAQLARGKVPRIVNPAHLSPTLVEGDYDAGELFGPNGRQHYADVVTEQEQRRFGKMKARKPMKGDQQLPDHLVRPLTYRMGKPRKGTVARRTPTKKKPTRGQQSLLRSDQSPRHFHDEGVQGSLFDEADHPRDGQGRFFDKRYVAPTFNNLLAEGNRSARTRVYRGAPKRPRPKPPRRRRKGGSVYGEHRRDNYGQFAPGPVTKAAKALEVLEKHPGHADQTVHGHRYGADPGRKPVGLKGGGRKGTSPQLHDAGGRFTTKDGHVRRRRIKRRRLSATERKMLAASAVVAFATGAANNRRHIPSAPKHSPVTVVPGKGHLGVVQNVA